MAKPDAADDDRGSRRRRHRRTSPPPHEDDWARGLDEPAHSPPRRGGDDEILRRPSGRNAAAHRRPPPARASLSSPSMRVVNPAMPLLVRSSTGGQGRGVVTKVPFYDDDLSRSDSRRTDSRRDGSPRSHHYRSTPDSRPSSRTSVSRSEDGSAAAEEKKTVADVVSDREALRERMGGKRKHRHHKRPDNIIYEEDIDDDREARRPPSLDERSPSRHSSDRHTRHLHSSRRVHQRTQSYDDDGRPPRSASKRSSKKYYESESTKQYPERPPSLRRSHTTGGSHAASSHSGASSRRSSLLGSFFGVSAQPHVPERPVRMVDCVVCMDELPSHKVARLKCGHRMCSPCLRRSFKLSISDPQSMPPKCCTADVIPLKHVEKLFDDHFKKTWNRKFHEYTTRNRIYCPSRRCGEWIKPENIYKDDGRKCARCTRCRTKVCCLCNGKWHSSRECPRDEETSKFLEQAKQEGWQRCHRCKAVVELKEGCNHMTCRCGAEFCMICGVKWKTCECPWFSFDALEDDLLENMQIPADLRGFGRFDAGPPSPTDYRSGPGGLGAAMRQRPMMYGEEMTQRRQQVRQDEDLARRFQAFGSFDDSDDYQGGIGNTVGMGNAAGHFMNDDYRRRPDKIIVPPPPSPRHPEPHRDSSHAAPFERANTGMDYVAGVQRARGVRGSSMERRLADRFSTDHKTSPSYRQTAPPLPPMPAPHQAPVPMTPMQCLPRHSTMPMAPAPPPAVPPGTPLLRRHTMEESMYNNNATTRSPRSADRVLVSGGKSRRSFHPDAAAESPPASGRHRIHRRDEEELPRMSVLAGLGGPGRGMNRVFEWSTHVAPGAPQEEEEGAAAAAGVPAAK